jgi:hypothetical protein
MFKEELDTVLQFADSQNRTGQFVPRLESKNTQRDEALNELRVAYFFHRSGFPIVQWEPPGLNGKRGEYLLSTPEGGKIFVEVKSPGWESELSDAERQAGRTKEPKYRGRGGGAVRHSEDLRRCISSAYPKFAPTQPNLLVISDDFLVPLDFTQPYSADIALYDRHSGYFMSSKYKNIGGIGIFTAEGTTRRGVEYRFQVFDNPFALVQTMLPESILSFKASRNCMATVLKHSVPRGLPKP